MTALAYFSKSKPANAVSLVCPACGTAFPVPLDVLRTSAKIGCPACRHERAAPALPTAVVVGDEDTPLSEFPRGSTN